MVRKKSKKRSKKGPKLGSLALTFVVLIALGVAAVRYVRTPAGVAFLLDAGFDGRYESVQKNLDRRIVQALILAGIERRNITIETERARDGRPPPALLRATVPDDISLIEVNALITESIAKAGGRVRSCAESNGGRVVEMEIGTRRHKTHNCIIKKRRTPREREEGAEPVIALIVDDFGYFYNSLVKEFLTLEIPLTLTVIPGLRHTKRICEAAVNAGKEILCHLPMEPEKGGGDGGEIPLIRVAMKGGEIRDTVEQALQATPGVIGMNNHMGSRATADRRVMENILEICKRHGLFFIDSMTTQRSVVGETAKRVGVPSLSNDLFIDNAGEDMRENMRKIISISRRKGYAVGIMHVKSATLKDLKWMIGEAERAGVKFVNVSDMIAGHSTRR
jgi:polysaccharide deacetylase 2 family uncharacterized protein YibQ